MCSRPGPRSSSRMKQRPRTTSVVVAAVRPSSRPPPKTVSTRKKLASERDRDREARRDGEGGERAQQPPAVERAVAGGQRQHEGGDPDREEGGDRQVARQEGEGEARDRDQQDQRRRVDGLGQVEPAEAVDVAGDAPALGDRAGQPRELVLQQDDVGDALGDLAARAHRHGHPRPLQRRHVVDAVADHRREAAAVRQGRDQRLLLLGADAAEDRVALGHLAQRAAVAGQLVAR